MVKNATTLGRKVNGKAVYFSHVKKYNQKKALTIITTVVVFTSSC